MMLAHCRALNERIIANVLVDCGEGTEDSGCGRVAGNSHLAGIG